MKRVMCGKMAVAYQNVDIGGKGPGDVVYKVGSKAGQQQCGAAGSPKSTRFKMATSVHNQNDAAVWNIIALSMCLRPQSPDSNGCLASSPFSSTPSSNSLSTSPARAISGGEKQSSPTCTTASIASPRLFSGLGTRVIGRVDQEKRSRSTCSTGSDEEESLAAHFEEQHGGMRVGQRYDVLADSSRLFGGQPQDVTSTGKSEVCSSSSSIGGCDDSSCSSGEGSNEVSSSGDMEVESPRRDGPLHHMSALEDSLPIKRGLSRFWNGKAKSFSSLADVSSVEQLAKPDNPYARRRRTAFGERHKSFPPLSCTSTAGISKRPPSNSGSRGGLAMAVAMGSKLAHEPIKLPSHSYSSRSMSLTDLVRATSDQP